MSRKVKKPFLFALLAAALYAVSAPVSKILLEGVSPVMLASLLYLGAGAGMFMVGLSRSKKRKEAHEAKISKSDLPFVIGMVVLDIAAPVFLLAGLSMTTAGNASLLNNFEIVATTLVAILLFKEHVGRKLWIAIGLITSASLILSLSNAGGFSFSSGSAMVLLACVCWGLENNCTRMISIKDPLEIVVIKGICSGLGSFIIAAALKVQTVRFLYAVFALLLGFLSYGLSIYFYVLAQRYLGAAKTSAYYAISPFIGVGISFLVFREKPGLSFFIALLLMAAGTALIIHDRHRHAHLHAPVTHEHLHTHDDGHHEHRHPPGTGNAPMHAHVHDHATIAHSHEHEEDLHHVHTHDH